MLSIGKMNQVSPLSAIINMILMIILVSSYCFLCSADWKYTSELPCAHRRRVAETYTLHSQYPSPQVLNHTLYTN